MALSTPPPSPPGAFFPSPARFSVMKEGPCLRRSLETLGRSHVVFPPFPTIPGYCHVGRTLRST